MSAFFRMTEMIRTSIDRLLYTSFGQIIISAIFGFALALLFHRVCKKNCTNYYAPHVDEVQGKVFRLEDVCYKYTPHVVKCDSKQPILNPYDVNTQPVNKGLNIFSNINQN